MNRSRTLVLTGTALVLLLAAAHVFVIGPALRQNRPTLMYFRADLWAYCKETTPIVDGIRKSNRGRLNVVYVSIDESSGKEKAKAYDVVGTPTILLLNREGEQVQMLRGTFPKEAVQRAVDDLLNEEP